MLHEMTAIGEVRYYDRLERHYKSKGNEAQASAMGRKRLAALARMQDGLLGNEATLKPKHESEPVAWQPIEIVS